MSKNYWLIVSILSVYFLSLVPTANEEHYFGLALQWFNPDWIVGSFSFTESTGTRILYQCIAGPILYYTSFEFTSFVLKLVVILLTALALSYVYKQHSLSWRYVLLHLTILIYLPHLMGNQPMFLGAEAKHFAYIFILASLYQDGKNRVDNAILLISMASIFHILAGGWFLIYYLIYRRNELNFKNFIYVGPTVVFGVYLYLESAAGISNAQIYTHLRNPHHTAAYLNFDYYYNNHFLGLLLTGSLLCISLKYFKNNSIAKLNNIIMIGLIVSAIIGIFDKGGDFIKYLPLRISNISVFLFFLTAISIVRNGIDKFYKDFNFGSTAVFVCVPLVLYSIYPNIKKQVDYSTNELKHLGTIVRSHVPKGETVLNFTNISSSTLYGMDGDVRLERFVKRPIYVTWKFVPAGTNKLDTWYERVQINVNLKQAILDNRDPFFCDGPANYILSSYNLPKNCYEVVARYKNYKLYKR